MVNIADKAVFIFNLDEKTRHLNYATSTVLRTDSDGSILSFNTHKYVPAKGDKIWFYPGCEVPRFKVKQFCIKHDVAVVKYKEKSSVRFIGPEAIKNLLHQFSAYCIDKQYFINFLDTIMCNAYEKLKEDIVKSESQKVYLYDNMMRTFCDDEAFNGKVLFPSYNDVDDWVIGCKVKDDESLAILTDMINDPGLHHQDDLLSILNTGTVLDEEMYQQIKKMFKSSDNDNTRLAMEAMANCDYQKSAVYLLLLLKKFGSKIQSSGNTHHVNFKSLIKYFQIKTLNSISVDDMIDALRHQKLLNLDNLNRLMPMALKRIKEGGDMRNLIIKEIVLSPDAERAVNENILDKMELTVIPTEPEVVKQVEAS